MILTGWGGLLDGKCWRGGVEDKKLQGGVRGAIALLSYKLWCVCM